MTVEPLDIAGRVLIVDDAMDLRRLIAVALRRGGFEVMEASSGEAALGVLEKGSIDVLVLDMGLPGMSGVDVVRALRGRPETLTLPILLMTGSGTSQSVIEGLDAGADDFLAKPVRLDELVARVRAHLRSREAWSRVVADELRLRASVVSALDHMTLSAEPEVAAEAIVNELAKRTDMPFISVLQLVSGDRLQPLAMYNRSQGLSVRGPLLHAGRSGYLLRKAREGPWAERVPDRLPGEPDNLFWSAGLSLFAGAPIYAGETLVGILDIGAVSEHATPTLGEQAKLMAEAIDYASILSVVAGSALADRRETVEIRKRLRRELAARAFYPVFQPIVELETLEVVGFEAMTRFADGTRPDLRFAEATAYGMGEEFELAAIEAAVGQAVKLPEGLFLSLNISPAVALSAGKRLPRVLADLARPVVLELTEHVPIEDYPSLRQALDAMGDVEIAVDDAGAGYASMRHILELRPAFAKLDISLVRGIDGDELRQAMAAGFQYYALRTGCRLIAEGVETDEEANTLKALGVDFGQGYLFGRPERLTG
jgi:EAL domain-containing protein (putative c-di-GMP-specific phosphodiesterase class I)/CheY-like chemotaxis protein